MWLAKHFPGLNLDPERFDELTPELTASMRKVGTELLKAEADERWAHTKVLAMSAGVRVR